MDLTISTTALRGELALLEKVTPRRPAMAVLSTALLSAVDGAVSMVATDTRVGVRTRMVGAQVAVPGTALVPVAKLGELLRTMPDTQLRLRLDGHAVRLSAAGFNCSLQVQSADDYPRTPEPAPESLPRLLPAPMLRSAIERTSYAIAGHEDPRGAIHGALLDIQEGKFNMVATDGHRLVWAHGDLPDVAPISGIISRRALEALASTLDGETGHVEYDSAANHVFFSLNDRLVFSLLIEGAYPNWRRLIPADRIFAVDVNRAALLAALRRARMLSADVAASIRLEAGALHVTAAGDSGQGDEAIPVMWDHEPTEIMFNAKYLMDFAESVGSENIALLPKDDSSALLARAEDDGLFYSYVVMPIRR
jgi:DNA polymerase-3 subunit beta